MIFAASAREIIRAWLFAVLLVSHSPIAHSVSSFSDAAEVIVFIRRYAGFVPTWESLSSKRETLDPEWGNDRSGVRVCSTYFGGASRRDPGRLPGERVGGPSEQPARVLIVLDELNKIIGTVLLAPGTALLTA